MWERELGPGRRRERGKGSLESFHDSPRWALRRRRPGPDRYPVEFKTKDDTPRGNHFSARVGVSLRARSARQRPINPKGIESFSPGLRGTSSPRGTRTKRISYPEWVASDQGTQCCIANEPKFRFGQSQARHPHAPSRAASAACQIRLKQESHKTAQKAQK